MTNASVYDELREAIASGAISPSTPLTEIDLMKRFDAGRPAVRTALLRLEQEGLVEQEKGHSARVRLIGRDEALEISETRALLECYAVALAARQATAADVSDLEALVDKSDAIRSGGRLSELVDIDTQFHQRILELAGNRTVGRLYNSLHGHLARHHQRTRLEQESSGESAPEHRAIVAAIAAGDPAAASAAMRVHLDRLTKILREALDSDR